MLKTSSAWTSWCGGLSWGFHLTQALTGPQAVVLCICLGLQASKVRHWLCLSHCHYFENLLKICSGSVRARPPFPFCQPLFSVLSPGLDDLWPLPMVSALLDLPLDRVEERIHSYLVSRSWNDEEANNRVNKIHLDFYSCSYTAQTSGWSLDFISGKVTF